jgi:methylated-DNA-[protein]-cysteine S-methyltransferase
MSLSLDDTTTSGSPARAWALLETAWGWVALAGNAKVLDYVGYPELTEDQAVACLHHELGRTGPYDDAMVSWATDPIRDYFDGKPIDWGDFPVRLVGTPLQVRTWEITREIGYGRFRTYGGVATLAGWPRAARAVGTALAKNCAGLLVPCHRVVAVDGLGGYGRWRERKVSLLRLEGVISVKDPTSMRGPLERRRR